jgi:hypothetical protein
MQRRDSGFPRGVLKATVSAVVLLAAVGCTSKPAYVQGPQTDVAYRWKVERVEPTRLSEDQRATFERRGPPTYVRFFREVETRNPVYAWIYADEGDAVDLVWFVNGQRVEAIAVDNDPSAFSSTTRRRVRYTMLIGTGVAIVPAVVLLANR